MEMLTSFLNPTQIGQLREVTKSVSLEDVAEVATTGFRSMGTTREDSLVFVLGLLNLGTVLCYAVYSQLFKPVRRGSNSALDENHFVFKKIQTILDELVLHVHTTTYYRSSLEKSQELARGRESDSTFRARSGAAPSIYNVFSFFDLPEPAVYGEKEPPLPHQSSRRTDEDYQSYLQQEAKKMIQEWLSFLVQSALTQPAGRLTKRHTRMPFPHAYRRNMTLHRSSPQIKKRIAALTSSNRPSKSANRAEAKTTTTTTTTTTTSTTTRPPTTRSSQKPKWNRERASQRRPQMKRPVVATTSAAEADGRELAAAPSASSSSEPDVPHPAHQDVPVLPVHTLFPHETVRERGAGSGRADGKRARASSRSGMRSRSGQERRERNEVLASTKRPEPRHIPSEFRQQLYRNPTSEAPYDLDDSASSPPVHSPPSYPMEQEDGIVIRLMHLIQQTTPLAMDVLGVFKANSQHQQSGEPKCLERLLCQLNQDWKTRGSVPAAMAPFLSISMGWLLERSAAPQLSHVLMAVRAGWIGKQCATLYPRCANPSRPQWTVAPLHDDSLNLPSIGQPPVKVRPPLDFFVSTPTSTTVHLDSSTLRPSSTSIRNSPSTKPFVPHSSESSDLRTTPSTLLNMNDGIRKVDKTPPDWVREGDSNSNGVWGQHSIEMGSEEHTSATLIGTSLQVDRNGQSGPNNNRPENAKPWGKPSRFSGADSLELSDIVRGVYPPATEKNPTDEEEDEEYEDDEEDEEEEEEEEEENGQEPGSSTKKPVAHYTEDSILYDLNKNHFTEKPQASNQTKSMKDQAYEEHQKKKTDRLEMVPHRGLVHPWLSEPVWVPENAWPPKPTDAGNRLRSDEDYEESTDRHRDRVSFSHEDAVKDVRLFDFAMQYLRDRSA